MKTRVLSTASLSDRAWPAHGMSLSPAAHCSGGGDEDRPALPRSWLVQSASGWLAEALAAQVKSAIWCSPSDTNGKWPRRARAHPGALDRSVAPGAALTQLVGSAILCTYMLWQPWFRP